MHTDSMTKKPVAATEEYDVTTNKSTPARIIEGEILLKPPVINAGTGKPEIGSSGRTDDFNGILLRPGTAAE